jgi:membrane protease YdiL (CAAX protease family)
MVGAIRRFEGRAPTATGVGIKPVYPITVVVEETFFRGFLQSRLSLAPPVTAGVLFALYHLNQWHTIPSLIPYGIALGVLRWWCGSIWVGAGMHYLGDALFLLSLA